MAQDIRRDFSGSTVSVTMTLNNLGDGSSVDSSEIDFGAQAPDEAGFHVEITGLAGSTARCEWYMKWSEATGADFTDDNNAKLVHTTLCNGTTLVDDHFSVPVRFRYGKLRCTNNSGAALGASGNSAEYAPVAVDQA